jgi:hypothetical protein
MRVRKHRRCLFLFHLLACTLLCASRTRAAEWFDPAWPFRRQMDVTWDAEHQGDDGEIAVADFYTAGHHLPNGEDVRVVADDGTLCPVRILKVGPGDTIELIFRLVKFQRKYAVYWGNPHPPPLPRNIATDFPIRFGLLLEMKGLDGGNGQSIQKLESAWERGTPDYGAMMIDSPFIGYNPVITSPHTIGRLTGSIFAPADGAYEFAGSCADKGSLYIDGKPILYIPGCPGDIRFNTMIQLARGRHDFMMYHLSNGDQFIISLGWKQPGAAKVEIINRESFGICDRGMPGPLEEIRKDLTADFKTETVAECFEHDPSTRDPEHGNYSELLRFTALPPKDNPEMKIEWDFGDGQKAQGATVDHVFMTDGVYPVRLSYRLGQGGDAQTNGVLVARDLSHPDQPRTNDPPVQSKIVATYDVSQMPVNWLPWATVLHAKAGGTPAMLATAGRLASEPRHGDANLAYATLLDLTQNASPDPTDVAKMWSNVPRQSDLQPRAVKLLADELLWDTADFAAAKSALAPFVSGKDPGVARRYAQATLLLGNLDEAKKIFEQQTTDDTTDRAAAISGAMARTVEFFITQANAEAGDDAWDKWQNRFPSDFLEGYSALLRVKLINIVGHPAAAAKVAEAFARAVPHSSYSPSLLDQASKLLAQIDPAKSAILRAMLKERYPEDPLSQ